MLITGHQITKTINGKCLFTIPQLALKNGQKIGLIGVNGSGKTTLLKLLAGLDKEYQGKLTLNTAVGYLPQLKAPSNQSGGQQTLTLFKDLLGKQTNLLLLDEPTANLDEENKQWLSHQVKKYRGTVLTVSHDSDFLRQVADEIWVLDKGEIRMFPYGYDDTQAVLALEREKGFLRYQIYEKKVKQLQTAAAKQEERAKKLKKKKKSVSRSDWKVNSKMGNYDGKQKSLAKVAKALEHRLECLEAVTKPNPLKTVKMSSLGSLSQSCYRLLNLKSGTLALGNQGLLTFPDFRLNLGDKVVIRGRNQSGKTTFLKHLLAKSLLGFYAPQLKIGYFAQDLSILNDKESIFATVSQGSVQPPQTMLTLLASFGFSYERRNDLVASLSGGERVTLSLVKILLSDCNCLLLDEPNNYLDLPTLAALRQFLQDFEGACVLVSHDKELTASLTDRHYVIKDGVLQVSDDR